MHVVSGFGAREIVVMGRDLNGHVGERAEGYIRVHAGSGFGIRNREGVRILEFGDIFDMAICNTLFKVRPSRLVTYKSGCTRS